MYSDHVDDSFKFGQIFALIITSVALTMWLLLPISSASETSAALTGLNSEVIESKGLLFLPVACVLLVLGMIFRSRFLSGLAVVAGILVLLSYAHFYFTLNHVPSLGLGFFVGVVATFLLTIMAFVETMRDRD